MRSALTEIRENSFGRGQQNKARPPTAPDLRGKERHQTLPRGIWVDWREACRVWTRVGTVSPRPLHRLICKTCSLCFPFTSE